MAIKRIKAPIFNLDIILKSGQAFGWKKIDGWWTGEISGRVARVRQKGDYLEYVKEGEDAEENIRKYFSLDIAENEMKKRYAALSKDKTLGKAVNEFYGLRILRQDPWYCTATFVCSSFSNIPRIEKTIEKIRVRHGRKIGNGQYLFPSISEIKRLGKEELRKCGLGFRDRYLHEIANSTSEKWFEEIDKIGYAEAKKRLLRLSGIGEKVADCILLFGYGKGEAFPVDVWIRRAMVRFYGKELRERSGKRKISDRIIREFAVKKWGKNAGLAQQFLYMYARKHRIR